MRCLVTGYGSIGKRHAEVLTSLGHDVCIVSRHLPADGERYFNSIRDAVNTGTFNYAVIATETSKHADTLTELLDLTPQQTVILVEKPLFSSSARLISPGERKIAVGYVLRSHPLLRKMKLLLQNKKILSCRAACGQYLPDWRPGSDYRNSYSAFSGKGGGVLRDLSHELDYMSMLCGKWLRATAIGGKFSDLQISSDDQYSVLFETEKCPLCSCTVDYLARDVHRDIYIEYNGGSLHLDFIRGTLTGNGETETVKLERNTLFATMHQEVSAGNFSYFPDFAEAVNILKLIDAAETAAGGKKWIENR